LPRPFGLLVAGFDYAGAAEDEFNDWYDSEHLPALQAVPGCMSARRFRMRGGTHRYAALYHLTSPEVCASAAWKDAAKTAWALRIIPHLGDRLRIALRRYQRPG